jgi:hypothetical protein
MVTVTIANATNSPLPLRAVQLAMRQRRLCFDAAPHTAYLVAYGDPAYRDSGDAAMAAPETSAAAQLRSGAAAFDPAAKPLDAALEPEQRNPQFRAPSAASSFVQRHPAALWIALAAVIAPLAAAIIAGGKQQTGRP